MVLCRVQCQSQVGRSVAVPVMVLHIVQLSFLHLVYMVTEPVVCARCSVGREGFAEIIVAVQGYVHPLHYFEMFPVGECRGECAGRVVSLAEHEIHT